VLLSSGYCCLSPLEFVAISMGLVVFKYIKCVIVSVEDIRIVWASVHRHLPASSIRRPVSRGGGGEYGIS